MLAPCAEARMARGAKVWPYHRAMSPQGSDTHPRAERAVEYRAPHEASARGRAADSSAVGSSPAGGGRSGRAHRRGWWRGAFAVPPPPPRGATPPSTSPRPPRRPRPPISHRPSRPRSLLLSLEKALGVADSWSAGPPAVMTTTFRPDPTQPTITAYVTWMRSATTQLALYPGYEGPGSTPLNRGPEMVPQSHAQPARRFNSGFYESDASAGSTPTARSTSRWSTAWHCVSYTDGTVDMWTGRWATPGPTSSWHARPPAARRCRGGDGGAACRANGVTLGGVPQSAGGLGVDAKGNLLYVAASDQTAAGLAQI